MEFDPDPNIVILTFLSTLPPMVRDLVQRQLVAMLPNQPDELEIMFDTAFNSRVLSDLLLESKGLALIGATVSVAALLDFFMAQMRSNEPLPELDAEIEQQIGSPELGRRHLEKAATKWTTLRTNELAETAILAFAERATNEPIEPPERTVEG